jgi:hypothetical protein
LANGVVPKSEVKKGESQKAGDERLIRDEAQDY